MAHAQPDVSPRTVTLRIYTRYDERTVYARPVLVGDAHLADGAIVELRLVSERTGKVVRRRTVRHLLSRPSEVSFSMRGVISGCCSFQASVTDRHGRKFRARVILDRSPGAPVWLGSGTGVCRQVPSPWTPVHARPLRDGFAVSCWGREIALDRTHLLKHVSAQNRSLLTGPVQWIAQVNGKAVRWRNGRLDLLSQEPRGALFQGALSAPPLTIRTSTEIEFDGMVRVDWELTTSAPVRLDTLRVEIPIRRRHAKYLYHFPGRWGSAQNVGALPDQAIAMEFRPFVWIGDEDRGFSWFCERDENWHVSDPYRAIEVIPQRDRAILRLNLVSTPVLLLPEEATEADFTGFGKDAAVKGAQNAARGLRYSFGFQATPVKPVEKDAWDHRIFCIGWKTPGFRPRLGVSNALLDKLVAGGVRTVVIFEYWTDAEGHPTTPHGAALKKIVKACHARGLSVLLYFSFLISDLAPEWRDFGKDSVVMPKSGYPVFHYLPQPEQAAWRVCLGSPWQDRLVHGIAQALKEYDADGLYLDGTEYPFGCCNTEHGCGRVGTDGTITPTYPIMAVRSALRRIYQVVRAHRPDGQINIHNSTCMTIPTLEWGTGYWDGEQFANVMAGSDMTNLLPLDAFRAEFMGRQWGVAAEFLSYDRPLTHERAWSFTLLHDVPVRLRDPDTQLGLLSSLWRTMDAFGRKEAEWLPYWSNERYVRVSPRGAYASLYRHPKNGVLVVLSNVSRRPAGVRLDLNLGRLGLKGNTAHITNALTGTAVPHSQGRLRHPLESFGWELLWVRKSV